MFKIISTKKLQALKDKAIERIAFAVYNEAQGRYTKEEAFIKAEDIYIADAVMFTSPHRTKEEDVIEKIIELARAFGYRLAEHQKSQSKLRFMKGADIVDVWYSKMTVGVVTQDPKKGRVNNFVKRVTFKKLEEIFANPLDATYGK